MLEQERQNRAAVLLKVNVLATAQIDRHVSGASRIAGAIELAFVALARSSTSPFLRLVWNGSPHFPRAGVPQNQSAAASEGYECGWIEETHQG